MRRVATVQALLVVALVLPLSPVRAAARITEREQVFPGLVFERLETTLENGDTVHGTVTRFRIGAPYLQLRVAESGGNLAGLKTVPGIERDLAADGAIAAVNGGFWVDPPHGGPTGRPHGVSIMEGQLQTGARTLWGHPGHRGTVGIAGDGSIVFSRLASALTLTRPDGGIVPIDELNTEFMNERGWDAQVLLYTPRYPFPATIPEGGVAVVLQDLSVAANTVDPAVVTAVVAADVPTSLTSPVGGGILVAEKGARSSLEGLAAGDEVTIGAGVFGLDGVPERWDAVVGALPGGPYIVRDGARTRSADWIGEGFSHERHNGPRTARTAVALTAADEVLLVTVDGRQPGWSPGMNMWELANLLVELGAVEALSLDGGGSTTATVLGEVRNRPSDGGPRPVANALVVAHSYPFAHTDQIGGRDRYDTAARIATTAYPDGAAVVVLATGRNFPDALAGGPLAAHVDAPLLLADTDVLPATTEQALDALDPSTVLVLGGPAAVSTAVSGRLTDRGHRVVRSSGPDRFATATEIATALVNGENVETVVVASGRGFADALVAAAPAGRIGAPILLTEATGLPLPTAAFLTEHAPSEVVIVGGEAVVGASVEEHVRGLLPGAAVSRLAGADRYGTAAAVAAWAEQRLGASPAAVIARGDAFPDALAGGPFAAGRAAPLMIVPPVDTLDPGAATTSWLEQRAAPLDRLDLLGGTAALPLHARYRLDDLVAR